MIRPQRDTEDEAAASRPVRPNRASKFTSERVILLVVLALLAAAVFVVYRLSFALIRATDELSDLKMKCGTQSLSETNPMSTVKPSCPPPPTGTSYEPCPKCEAGWEHFKGKCYHFTANKSPWEKSRCFCQSQGGDLVKIDIRGEQAFLEERLREVMKDPEDKFWIGLTDSKQEGRWLWVDGSPLDESLSYWSPKEPDNWIGKDPDGENCVKMGEKAGADDLKCWFDQSCKIPHRSICEKPEETGHRVSVCVQNRVQV